MTTVTNQRAVGSFESSVLYSGYWQAYQNATVPRDKTPGTCPREYLADDGMFPNIFNTYNFKLDIPCSKWEGRACPPVNKGCLHKQLNNLRVSQALPLKTFNI